MKKVLIVDDEPAVLFALSEALADRRRGVRVATAANGQEAVSVLESEQIDLVVTDLRMPEMDGFELIAHLRRGFPHLPVIVMTAYAGDAASGLDGVPEVLEKPFEVGDLKQKVTDLLRQSVKGRMENISLASFLQLLEMERKTCTLGVASDGHAGRLFFRGGVLVGAETEGLSGQEAALEIVTWEHADVEIADGCRMDGPEVEGGLRYILLEGMRLKDERERDPSLSPSLAQEMDDALEALLAPETRVGPPAPAASPAAAGRQRAGRPASPYDVRPFTPGDYAAAVDLWRETEGGVFGGADSPESIGRYLERNPGLSFVARDGDRIVATVLCGHDGRRGYLHHLAVAPDHRRRGLGRLLVERCLAALREQGIEKCHLFVFAGDAGGQAFWSRTGWAERPDLVVMSRTLADDPDA